MSSKNSFFRRRACTLGLYAVPILTGLAFASPSGAQIIQLTSANQLSSSDVAVTYPEAVLTPLPNPYTVTAGASQTLTFTNNSTAGNGNQFQRYDQQGIGAPPTSNFGGDFAPGTRLLRNAVTGSGLANVVTLTFSSPISQLGFTFEPTQANSAGTATFTFLVFEGAASTSFTVGPVTNRAHTPPSSTPAFFGVNDAGGNLITSIQIYGTPAGSSNGDDFVLSPMTLGSIQSVPEPGLLALLMGASLPMGLLAARRRRR